MTDRYAVFGNPISHSKSPLIHSAFAQSFGHTISYTRELAPLDGFAASVDAFRKQGGRGANVTVPFKVEAFALATHLSDNARTAGAVNALKFVDDEIHAENFDGVGLVNDIERNLNVSLKGKRVLILGAGGAARGALAPILSAQPAKLVIANRTMEKAAALASQFNVEAAQAGALQMRFDVVINSTSAALSDEAPDCAPAVFDGETLAYEMMYGKGLTPFLKFAQGRSAQLADGVGMLVEQAALAYAWWRGARPATGPVIASLKVPLV